MANFDTSGPTLTPVAPVAAAKKKPQQANTAPSDFDPADMVLPSKTAQPAAPTPVQNNVPPPGPAAPSAPDFDPQDIIQPTAQAANSDFDPADVVNNPQQPTGVYGEMQNKSMFDRPVLGSKPITDDEIQQIAQKHGVDPQDLRKSVEFMGGVPSNEYKTTGEAVKGTAGMAAGMLGDIAGSIPQKIYKQYKGGEMERALDDLQDLAQGRQSYARKAVTFASPLGDVAEGAQGVETALQAAKTGAKYGASFGYGGSKQGEEVQGTAIGAGTGALDRQHRSGKARHSRSAEEGPRRGRL